LKRLSTFHEQLRAIVLLWYGGTGTSIGNLSYAWDANKNKTSETISGTMSGYGFTSAGISYDDEDRFTGYARVSGTFTQSWSLTKVGDWNSVTTNGTAQNRTHGPTYEVRALVVAEARRPFARETACYIADKIRAMFVPGGQAS
jgi:hypothetical protein